MNSNVLSLRVGKFLIFALFVFSGASYSLAQTEQLQKPMEDLSGSTAVSGSSVSTASFFEASSTSGSRCPISFTWSRTNVTNCSGTPCDGSATVTGVTGGSGNYSYLWTQTGQPNQTTQTANNLCPGSVTIRVTDNVGGCWSQWTFNILRGNAGSQSPLADTLHVTLWTTYPQAGPPWYACEGRCISLRVEVDTSTGGGPYVYNWSGGAAGLTGPGPHQICPTSTASVGYTVSVTDAACVSTSITSTPEIKPRPVITSTNPVDVTCFGNCNGQANATHTGGTGPYTYAWSNGQVTQALTGLCPNTYTVTVRDSWGCQSLPSSAVINNGIDVLVNTSVVNHVSCPGGNDGSVTATATQGDPPFSYSWNTTPVQNTQTATGLTAGTYIVTVTDNKGCTKAQSVTVTQPSPMVINTTTVNVSCASLGSATVTGVTGGTGPFTYSWNTTPVQNTQTATGLTAGVYTVTVTDDNGCISTKQITITEPPPITFNTTTTNACGADNGTAAVVGVTGGTTPYTYSWNTVPPQTTAIATGLAPGTYTVTVTDVNGCSTTDTNVVVGGSNSPIIAGFTPDTSAGEPPLTVNFTNTSIGAVGYKWFFGDNTTDTVTHPTHTYDKSGVYTVILVAYHPEGCTDTTIYQFITVGSPPDIRVPNVFTPNGDKINDRFIIDVKGIAKIHVSIYNRWGQLIYEWDKPDGDWDGRNSAGSEVPAGTYYYLLRATGEDGTEFNEQGHVTLFR